MNDKLVKMPMVSTFGLVEDRGQQSAVIVDRPIGPIRLSPTGPMEMTVLVDGVELSKIQELREACKQWRSTRELSGTGEEGDLRYSAERRLLRAIAAVEGEI